MNAVSNQARVKREIRLASSINNENKYKHLNK